MEVENFKILLRISRVYIFEVHRKVDNKKWVKCFCIHETQDLIVQSFAIKGIFLKFVKEGFDFQNLCRYVGNFKLRLRFEVLKKLVNKKNSVMVLY